MSESVIQNSSYLISCDGIYYYSLRVPADLHKRFNKDRVIIPPNEVAGSNPAYTTIQPPFILPIENYIINKTGKVSPILRMFSPFICQTPTDLRNLDLLISDLRPA